MKLMAKNPVTVEQIRDRIIDVLTDQKRNTLRGEYLKRLRDRYHVQLNQSGMDLLIRKVNATGEEAKFSHHEQEEPVYRYDGGSITIEKCFSTVLSLKKGGSPVGEGQIAGLMRDRLLPPVLMEIEAKRLKLDKQISTWVEAKREESLIRKLRSSVLTGLIVADADLRTYYDAHQDELRSPAQADIIEVNQIKRGADIAEVARQKSIRRGGNRFHIHPFEANRYGHEMVEKVFRAEVGEICGPIQTSGGYSVFKILSRQEKGLRPFEDVRSTLNGRVHMEKEHHQFEAFMQDIRTKYQHQITIFEELLKHVATQDSLAVRT
jgi:hypothetical protein